MMTRWSALVIVFMAMLVWHAGSVAQAQKSSASDALGQCKQKLGPGAIAEEELEFGETSYVCGCASPYQLNADNTTCMRGTSGGQSGQASVSPPVEKAAKPARSAAAAPAALTAKQLFDKALNNYKDGNYAIAAFWYKKASKKGSVGAMVNLGVMYRDGIGVLKSANEAVRLFSRAADLGIPAAMYQLSYMLSGEENYRRDLPKAFSWSMKAAKLAHAGAMNQVGYAYMMGKGVRKNNAKAASWFRKAIDGGYKGARYYLGTLFEYGRGVRRDRKRAAELLAQSLRDGDNVAVSSLTVSANTWSRQFKRELQRILKREGVYNGAIDGIFGPVTKRAVRELAGQ